MSADKASGRFTGKTAIVTGGSSGIGLETAKAFAAEGAQVLIAARDEKRGKSAEDSIRAAGGAALFHATDVSDSGSVKSMVDACVSAFGKLDIAFNNAGILGDIATPLAEAQESDFDAVMNVNVKGVWLCMKHQIPAMLKTGGGAIINCGSLASLRGGKNASAYYTSKHAMIGATKAAALEYAAQNVRVNAICPAIIMTDLMRASLAAAPDQAEGLKAQIPMGRGGEPDEVARAVLWLASAESSFVSGATLTIDGGLSV